MLNLKKWLNLKFQLFMEMFYSLLPFFYTRYLMRHRKIPANELKCLQSRFDCNIIKKIVLIGGGAIPYTALFLNQAIKPEIIVIIEKNKLASLAASRFLKKFDSGNCQVLNMRGEDYSGYDGSLVIIALQVIAKQMITDKILNESSNSILIVRQPLRRNIRMFEKAFLNVHGYMRIEQMPDFESIVFEKRSSCS